MEEKGKRTTSIGLYLKQPSPLPARERVVDGGEG